MKIGLAFEKIVKSYSKNGNELKQMREIGKKISMLMRTCYWLRWTKFPTAFDNCRTESDFFTIVDEFNNWLKVTNLRNRMRQENPDEVIEDENQDEAVEKEDR